MKPTLYMETTAKSPEQTIAEIQIALKQFCITAVQINYGDSGEVEGMAFMLPTEDGRSLPIKVPANWRPLWKMAQDGLTKYIKDEAQARKVAWRQIYRWIQAQLALLNLKMVNIDEVFLPYIWNGKETIYEKLVSDGTIEQLALEAPHQKKKR